MPAAILSVRRSASFLAQTMKANMAEQSAIGIGLKRRGCQWFVGGALAIALMIGCHRAETSGDPEPAAAGAKDASATTSNPPAAPVVNQNDPSVDEKLDLDVSTGDKGPPPKFLKRKEVTAQFPDKTPQSTWFVKVYSDGSEVYDGTYTEYYYDGKKLMDGEYVDGLKQGAWKFWGKNGKLIKTETYRDGKFDGSWTLFREDGSKERDVSYKAGKRDGKWIFYDAAGKNQPIEQDEYKQGPSDGTRTIWYPDGTKQSEEHFKDGQLDGEQTHWFPNGKKQEFQTFKNGVPVGKQMRWNENGEPRE
jgi:antitoxin component YwqK of YwqJK toxin-antitoxin module